MVYVALLRGINVGGHTTISMDLLKKCFTELGFGNVTTYINSGNVIFLTNPTNQRKLEEKIEQSLDQIFSLSICVVVKNFDEMQTIIHHLPSTWNSQTDWRHNIIFLAHEIDSNDTFKDFSPKPGIEDLHYFPGVLLWSAKTSDLTKSTMLQLNRSPLYKKMTVRNLNTTSKIFEIMQNLQNKSAPQK